MHVCFSLEDVEGADITYKSLSHDKKTPGLPFMQTKVLLNFEGSWGIFIPIKLQFSKQCESLEELYTGISIRLNSLSFQ